MDKIGDINRFKERQNIILEGFDPVTAGGFTQIPNVLLKQTFSNNATDIPHSPCHFHE
jgi:hypothetical protein